MPKKWPAGPLPPRRPHRPGTAPALGLRAGEGPSPCADHPRKEVRHVHETVSPRREQNAPFAAALAADLASIPPGRAMLGVAVGREVAQQVLAWRSTDGSNAQVTYVPGTGPGAWQPTPRPNPSPPPAELPGLPAAATQWAKV